jgi:hypothetical protein
MFTMKREVVGRSSVVSGELVQSVDQKICEGRRFTISELSCEFPQISRTILYEINTGKAVTSFAQDGFRKCSRVRTNHREWLRLYFLEQYHKDGDEFHNHIVRVTDD